MWSYFVKLKIQISHDPDIPLGYILFIYPKELLKNYTTEILDTCIFMFIDSLFKVARKWK